MKPEKTTDDSTSTLTMGIVPDPGPPPQLLADCPPYVWYEVLAGDLRDEGVVAVCRGTSDAADATACDCAVAHESGKVEFHTTSPTVLESPVGKRLGGLRFHRLDPTKLKFTGSKSPLRSTRTKEPDTELLGDLAGEGVGSRYRAEMAERQNATFEQSQDATDSPEAAEPTARSVFARRS